MQSEILIGLDNGMNKNLHFPEELEVPNTTRFWVPDFSSENKNKNITYYHLCPGTVNITYVTMK